MMRDLIMGEAFAPDWPDDQRIPYALVMLRFFELCKNYCRGRIGDRFGKQSAFAKWLPGESERGYAYEQLECSFSFPIEELMLEVATLILDGGRSFENEQWMNYHRAKIQVILQKNDLQAMLAELPQPERGYFESDLKLLMPLGLFGSWQG